MVASVTVVIATRERRASLARALGHLRSLPESPPIVVVDNGSRDGTVEMVRREHPGIVLIEIGQNRGAAARNAGVEAAETPYVAFCDDDSWWAPGSLERACSRMDEHPHVGLIAARILVGPGEVPDPTCGEMAASPLPPCEGLPWPTVLGFLACGAIARRSTFLEVGGFHPRFGVGGEERLLAIDLAAAGWDLLYCEDLVAHHHPEAGGERPGRRRRQCRNDLWSAWLRRPFLPAARLTARTLAGALLDGERLAGLAEALRGSGWVWRERRPVPRELERRLRLLGA
jgi:GT2 family glycosyltransferase